ncbi:hypothetical protein CBA19CS22_18000 [Caballeronia novacaledonica]|uniref:Uncharacterized protein n=1 Tax=Caballeronia novacaledonica TaxID=1544861 RepID=A0ACB5QTQ8_9BURK|nr:hypothetical protein CBA19CS22_18000 [Caballeronia novacaledonica]
MEPDRRPGPSAYKFLLTDADLVHLRSVISMEVADPNRVFPLFYWRRRVARFLEAQHLLPAQLAAASSLLDMIESADPDVRPLAKAS